MTRAVFLLAFIFLSVLSESSLAAGLPVADELLRNITQYLDSLKSLELDIKESLPSIFGPVTSTGHVAIQKSEEDGRVVEKYRITNRVSAPGANGKVEIADAKIVCDGTFVWLEEKRGDTVRVTKTSASTSAIASWIEKMKKDFTAPFTGPLVHDKPVVTGEDVIDGRKMYKLEGSMMVAGTNVENVVTLWVAQDDAFVCRMATKSLIPGLRAMVGATDFLNVKVNQPVDPALFTYTPPPGVKIDDRTGN